MTDSSRDAIERAIQNLQARQPKPRGRRHELAPFVERLRGLIAAGWTRTEIVAEIRANGAKVSPALLRDAVGICPAKPKNPKAQKPARSASKANPSAAE